LTVAEAGAVAVVAEAVVAEAVVAEAAVAAEDFNPSLNPRYIERNRC
jgi:hypothetical protein